MKSTKKVFAMIIAVIMTLCLSIGAFAATITITQDETYDGTTTRTYSAYKVFDADTTATSVNAQADTEVIYVQALAFDDTVSYYEYDATNKEYVAATVADATAFAAGTYYTVVDDADTKIAYTMAKNSPWKDVMLDTTNQIWFDVRLSADQSVYVVTLKDGVANNDTTAKAIAEYLSQNIPTNATATTVSSNGTAVTVDDGYYLIIADDGAPVVTLVTGNATIIEKNPYISVHKTAAEAAYQIGDFVEYTATVDIPTATAISYKTTDSNIPSWIANIGDNDGDGYIDGHGPIILHDTMDSTLTFVNASSGDHSYSAKIGTDPFTAFTLTTTTESADPKCTFHISIDVTSDLLGKSIVFTYYAEINETAPDETGLVNKLKGEFNGYDTNPDEPVVYTFDLDVKKVFVGDENNTNLTATFELRTDAADANTALKFTKTSNGDYIVADSTETNPTTTITLINGTPVNILGLEDTTYYLVELTTSTGYNLIDAPVEVIIVDTTPKTNGVVNRPIAISQMVLVKATEYDSSKTYYNADGTEATNVTSSNVTDYYIDTDDVAFEVENISGTLLPATGGIGTTIFYIVGAILVIGAAVVLVTRRRIHAE